MNKLQDIKNLVNYEKTMMKKGDEFPVDKLVEFFGIQDICVAYGLAKGNLTIARELLLIEYISQH